jgi:DNA replication protein DnaC
MAATRLHELREQWKGICPPLYRDTDPMRLPEVPLQTVLAWRYGSQGLLVHGDTGRGKTRAVFQLLRRLHFDEGRKIIRFGANDFGAECSKRFFDGDGSAWIAGLVKADVLFLDDLGKDRFTDRVESALFGLVEGRMSNLRPIIVTTNFFGDALASKMTGDRGQPLVRRLRESCQDVAF